VSEGVDPYDLLPDGVLVADGSGHVIALNRAGARLLDMSAPHAVGRDFRDVLPLTDATGRDWWACSRPYAGLSTRTRQPERQLTLPDGRDLLVTAGYLREPPRGGPVTRLVICFRDGAARDRYDRSRADLVSTVAHELRSPLTSVKGFTATLLAKWDRFTDAQRLLMLQTVNADADRVTRLISELLDVSRIDSGRLELRRQVVDLTTAVRRLIDGRVAAGEPANRFLVVVRGELPEMWLDPDKVDQVLGNLVENALRHGAGTVTITIEPVGAGAAITVADEGEGVSPEAATRIFRRFWRGTKRGGTGLGLYIVKGLVEAHGGSIEVHRAPSGGAAFRVVLPAGMPAFA
jgi:signal transduction histidine kinase